MKLQYTCMYMLATDQVISRRLDIAHFISSFCLFLKTYMLEKKEASIHQSWSNKLSQKYTCWMYY